MSAPILSKQLPVPPLRPDLVDRPQLFERLDAGLRLGHHLTLISATAGSGKSMLVAAWLQRIDRPVGWLAVDSNDNDPTRFATRLITALQRIDSGIGQAALKVLKAQHLSSRESLMGLLINDISATTTAFVLVLDNFQMIQTPAIHSMITFLLDHQPPQLHLVLLTRQDPPLPLSRLRARGQITELRTADLRFSTAEIVRFLQSRLVRIHALQTLAQRELCSMRQALACLDAAVDMVTSEEERRVFLAEGCALIELLPVVRSATPAFLDGVLAASQAESSAIEALQRRIQSPPPAAVPAQPPALLEPLSRREGEILRLVETGMPNEAVAHALVIAPGTVKKHLDNIYGKLGVHNRTEAVARAKQLDLL